LITRIREASEEIKIVVLSACDDRPSVDAALIAGADSFIVKSANPVDVASVMRQVCGGAVYHASSLRLVGGRIAEDAATSAEPILTDRELTILRAVAAGMTTAAISKDLWVSEHTVKFHLTNIYRKLGVVNRAGAVRYALANGIVAD
jgi:DNA-binding NarL/FixJ family response regulator